MPLISYWYLKICGRSHQVSIFVPPFAVPPAFPSPVYKSGSIRQTREELDRGLDQTEACLFRTFSIVKELSSDMAEFKKIYVHWTALKHDTFVKKLRIHGPAIRHAVFGKYSKAIFSTKSYYKMLYSYYLFRTLIFVQNVRNITF